jgi:uncharacterized coiled-coil protein SlyX
MEQLRMTLNAMSDELAGTRRESQELRQELRAVREELDGVRSQSPAARNADRPPEQARNFDDQVAVLAEDQQLLSAKVEDQYQTKVESGSKYRVHLSGMVLLNLFSTRGAVDNLDFPKMANVKAPGESNGSFAATARQSQFSLEVLGPQWKGAKTSGDVSLDFFGGFLSNPEGVTAGLVRTPPYRQGRFGLVEHVHCGGAGYSLLLAALSHVVGFDCLSSAFLCWQPLGMDSASSYRAPHHPIGSHQGDHPRWDSRSPYWRIAGRVQSSAYGRRVQPSAGLCDESRTATHGT